MNQVPNYAATERYTRGTDTHSEPVPAKRTKIDKNINLTTNQVPNYAATERMRKGPIYLVDRLQQNEQ